MFGFDLSDLHLFTSHLLSIFNKFVKKLEGFQSQIESITHFITLIDLIYAKSNIAKKYNYCKPKIVESDKSFVSIKSLRHCLIEQIQNEEIIR